MEDEETRDENRSEAVAEGGAEGAEDAKGEPQGGAPGGAIIEERIEEITREIAGLIGRAPAQSRRDLRDFATGLLRERISEALAPAPPDVREARTGSTFSAIGFAIPLFLMGSLLLFLFPPVGLVLLMMAVVMLLWGLVASLIFR